MTIAIDHDADIVTPADLGIPERTERLSQFERRSTPRTTDPHAHEVISPADLGLPGL